MPTLILSASFSEDSRLLWRAAVDRGWEVRRLSGWRVPPDLCPVEEPVLSVEALLGQMLAEQLGLELLEPAEDWLPALPEEYRRREIRLTNLAEARAMTDPAFIKPPNDKSFPAAVYLGAELPADYADDTSVLVAEPVRWEKEFRCFLLDRQLQTFSIYLRDGELQAATGFAHTPEEGQALRAFLTAFLADSRVELPRATVVDVGVIEGRGWAVVEQNGAWAAGLYGCEPSRVLDVLRHAVRPVGGD